MTTPTMQGLKGLNTVLRNLNKQVKKIEGRTMKGMIRGAVIIRRGMDKTPPKIPVDLGNLRASYFTVTSKGGLTEGRETFKGHDAGKMSSDHQSVIAGAKTLAASTGCPTVVLGFSADYAIYVHEMINAQFNREGAGAKFLQAHVKSNAKAVLNVIAEEARIR